MKIKKFKMFGNQTPWVWVIEPVHGCNLRCGHCCAGLIKDQFDKGEIKERYNYMSEDVWKKSFEIIQQVSPQVRVDICGMVGEPSLHPEILKFIKIARTMCPNIQMQMTTNGTMLRAGKLLYKDLLDAGLNIVYTDQYGSEEVFQKLAKESGYNFYEYYNKPEGAPSPWTYHGPDLKVIVLQEPPEKWPKSRFRANLLGNWYGNLEWKRGEKFGMKPLEKPLNRRCNQPFLYANISSEGKYLLCCQDGMQVTKDKFGTVNDGLEGFKNFWFGKEMQIIRGRLRNKDRASTLYACAKCNITFSRCDFKHWETDQLSKYYHNSKWENLEWHNES